MTKFFQIVQELILLELLLKKERDFMSNDSEAVLVVGAGPVGLVATASLISQGIPVKLMKQLLTWLKI